MRALVFLLILANLIFFAWSRGYFGLAPDSDAFRVHQQLLADRISVVSRDEPPPAKVGIAYKAPEKKAEEVCLRLAELPLAEAARLEALVAEQLPAYKAQRTVNAASASYWVFVPPLAARADVDKKVAELRKLGVPELFVVQDGGVDHLAISLGIFSTREAANERLEQLRAKTVRSAKVGERAGKPASAALEIRGPRSDALPLVIRAALPEAKPLPCLPAVVAAR